MSDIQITCAGSAVFDILAKSAGPLPIGVLGLVDTFSTAEGGPALRTGRVLAGMGIETRLIIPVGDDIFGRSFRETVPAPHLHVEFVECDLPTSTSLVAVDGDGERTMLHNFGADSSLTAEAIENRTVSDFLHVGGGLKLPGLDDPDGEPLAGLIERTKAKGLHTSLDVVHDSDRVGGTGCCRRCPTPTCSSPASPRQRASPGSPILLQRPRDSASWA